MYKIASTIRIVLVLFVLILFSCNNGSKKAPEKNAIQGEPAKIEVAIVGMTCTGCEQTIQTNVGKVEGIKSVKASWKEGIAVVEYYPQMTDTTRIKEAVTGAGYSVKEFNPVQGEITE